MKSGTDRKKKQAVNEVWIYSIDIYIFLFFIIHSFHVHVVPHTMLLQFSIHNQFNSKNFTFSILQLHLNGDWGPSKIRCVQMNWQLCTYSTCLNIIHFNGPLWPPVSMCSPILVYKLVLVLAVGCWLWCSIGSSQSHIIMVPKIPTLCWILFWLAPHRWYINDEEKKIYYFHK